MQQDNLINPQSVNEVIQTLFGSYEKFVMNMIERQRELVEEKLQLTQRLKEIEKEEGFIKSVLTGTPKKKNQEHYSTHSDQGIKNKLLKVQKEEELIKKTLNGFHGKKINGSFFDADNNSFVSTKPKKSDMPEQSSFQAIGELLAFKQEDYNKQAGESIINQDKLYTKPSFQPENSLLAIPDKSYRNEVISTLKNEYLSESLDLQTIDNKELHKARKNGIPTHDFVTDLAKKLNLKKIQQKQGMRFNL